MAEILIQRRRQRSVWPWLLGLLALALLPLPFLGDDRDGARAPRGRAATGPVPARADSTTLRDTTSPAAAVTGSSAAARGETGGAVGQSAGRTTATAAGALAPGGSGPAAGAVTAPVGPTTAAPTTPLPTGTPFERFVAARNPNPNDREQRDYTAGALHRLGDELRSLGASSNGVRAIRAYADSLLMPRASRNAHADYARAAFLAALRELDVLQARLSVPVDTARLRSTAWAIRTDQRLVAQRGTVQRFFEAARDALHSLSRRRS